jgi:hypothetical protein
VRGEIAISASHGPAEPLPVVKRLGWVARSGCSPRFFHNFQPICKMEEAPHHGTDLGWAIADCTVLLHHVEIESFKMDSGVAVEPILPLWAKRLNNLKVTSTGLP